MIIDNTILDNLAEQAKLNIRLRKNICLHESIDSPAQIMVNHLQPGSKIDIHRHLKTAETLFVLKGKSILKYYSDNAIITKEIILSLDDVIGVTIPKKQWHCLEIIIPTTLIEIKEGPYLPLTPDEILNYKLF